MLWDILFSFGVSRFCLDCVDWFWLGLRLITFWGNELKFRGKIKEIGLLQSVGLCNCRDSSFGLVYFLNFSKLFQWLVINQLRQPLRQPHESMAHSLLNNSWPFLYNFSVIFIAYIGLFSLFTLNEAPWKFSDYPIIRKLLVLKNFFNDDTKFPQQEKRNSDDSKVVLLFQWVIICQQLEKTPLFQVFLKLTFAFFVSAH